MRTHDLEEVHEPAVRVEHRGDCVQRAALEIAELRRRLAREHGAEERIEVGDAMEQAAVLPDRGEHDVRVPDDELGRNHAEHREAHVVAEE